MYHDSNTLVYIRLSSVNPRLLLAVTTKYDANQRRPLEAVQEAVLEMAADPPPYQPKDAIGVALKGLMVTGAAGTMVSGIQNTLTKQNVSGWGIITRTGGTIAAFGTMGTPRGWKSI